MHSSSFVVDNNNVVTKRETTYSSLHSWFDNSNLVTKRETYDTKIGEWGVILFVAQGSRTQES